MPTPMPKPFVPMLTYGEASEDGFVEIELSINGRFLAAAHFHIGAEDYFDALQAWWRAEIAGRC